jgi:RNA polymerase-binding transcription factor DksA
VQLESLRALLREREAALRGEISTEAGRRLDEPYAELAGEVPDLGDEASADLMVDIDNAMMGIELSELADIAAARQRMKKLLYGVCGECDQPIPYARLRVQPTALRCARCQALHEKTFATPGHATL